MKFTDEQAIQIIKKHEAVDVKTQKLREDTKELYALINGDDFFSTFTSSFSSATVFSQVFYKTYSIDMPLKIFAFL